MEAAALAAARLLPNLTSATTAARAVVQANGLDPNYLVIENPYDGNAMKVGVSYTDTRQTSFARALGISFLNYAARAAAVRGGSEMFEYALFSGSTLEDLRIGGAGLNVTGSVHSNEDLRFNGATVTDYTADVVRVKVHGKWVDMAKVGRAPCDNPDLERVW